MNLYTYPIDEKGCCQVIFVNRVAGPTADDNVPGTLAREVINRKLWILMAVVPWKNERLELWESSDGEKASNQLFYNGEVEEESADEKGGKD